MSEWISVKIKMPPYNEFVEVYMKCDRYSSFRRHFFAYIEIDGKSMWTSSSMCEDEWSDEGFGVTHWKKMKPDPKGKKAYIKKDGSLKIIFKKASE